MRITWLWLGIALLTLPASAEAQHQRGAPPRGLNGAVEKLLEYRGELGLTSDQLARLQHIKEQSDSTNRPSWQAIMAIRRELKAREAAEPEMSHEEKSVLVRRSFAEIRRLYCQIESNEHDAIKLVGKVLSPEQKDMVRQIIDENGDDGRRRGNSRDHGDCRG